LGLLGLAGWGGVLPRRAQRGNLILEISERLKPPVDRGEPQISHLGQVTERPENRQAYLVRTDLARAEMPAHSSERAGPGRCSVSILAFLLSVVFVPMLVNEFTDWLRVVRCMPGRDTRVPGDEVIAHIPACRLDSRPTPM
jgi:hypothetical protein